MILPGTIPETPISCEWSRQLEHPPDHVLYVGRPYGGFVNSAVKFKFYFIVYMISLNFTLEAQEKNKSPYNWTAIIVHRFYI